MDSNSTTFAIFLGMIEHPTSYDRFKATTLEEAPSGGGGGGGGLTAQEVRDAMKLAPTAGSPATGSIDKLLGGISVGGGNIAVNHNTGGTDNLRYTTSAGAGISGAIVKAFLKTDYDAGNRSDSYLKGRTVTDVNGRWLTDLYLDSGYTYTILFYKSGIFGPDTKEVTLP
jgi:hypothetical protein